VSLSSSIDALYVCFRRYRLSHVPWCPLCDSREAQRALLGVPLRGLSPAALDPFLLSSCSTSGDPEALKYFLPRIFEFLSASAFPHFVVDSAFVKLKSAQWRFWPGDEVLAVERFLLAWWRLQLLDGRDVRWVFLRLRSSGVDLALLLSDWLDLPAPKLALDLAWAVLHDPEGWDGAPGVAAYLERAFFAASTPKAERFLSWAYEVASGA
jgi:hypothetical protein